MTSAGEPGASSVVLTVAGELRSRVLLGTVTAEPVASPASIPALDHEIREIAGGLAEEHRGKAPSEVAGLAPARTLYRDLGIDPTRTRPSSEALFRRAVQGKPLPRILGPVDVCTLCSLRFLLSIGLYDAGKIQGEVSLRLGAAGESYPGIRKGDVHLEGRPALFDTVGPFGNPTSDSLRTSVGSSTTALFMVIFAPRDYPAESMAEHLAYASDRITRYLAIGTEPARIETRIIQGQQP